MKALAPHTRPQKISVVIDDELAAALKQHRAKIEAQTGLQISASAAAASLLRRALTAALPSIN